MPRPPRTKPPPGRSQAAAKRVQASLERKPGEVAAEVLLDAERDDPERVKHSVALVDGAKTQLDLVAADATGGLSSDTRKPIDTAPTTCSNAHRLCRHDDRYFATGWPIPPGSSTGCPGMWSTAGAFVRPSNTLTG